MRDFHLISWSRIGVGADLTAYRTSPDFIEYFGSPLAFHAFVRWRPAQVSTAHIH